MWLSCPYSNRRYEGPGERLKCYKNHFSGLHHSILALFKYNCSSHVSIPACYNVASSGLPAALPASFSTGLPCFFYLPCGSQYACSSFLAPVLCFRKPGLPGIICSHVVVWDCGTVTPLQSASQTRLPGEITQVQGDFPLPWEHFFSLINSGRFQ